MDKIRLTPYFQSSERGGNVEERVRNSGRMNGGDNQTLWDCLEYNRVRGVEPSEAEEMAADLMQFNRLWALIVFDSEIENNDSGRSNNDTSNARMKRSGNSIHPLESKRELSKDVSGAKNATQSPNASKKTLGNESTLNPRTVFRIRMSSEFVDNTEYTRDRLERPGGRFRPLVDLKYFTYGFAYIQDMIENSIISEQTGVSLNDLPGTLFQQYPFPCFIEDQFIKSISRMFPLFMVLAWIFTCSMIVKSIVYEKRVKT
uniref:Uncharacterized protein n=1 Tax=Lygus hesperus TaxID=30085 RepID=A0A0K8TEH8_LYGHE